jgi:hypothetical protein
MKRTLWMNPRCFQITAMRVRGKPGRQLPPMLPSTGLPPPLSRAAARRATGSPVLAPVCRLAGGAEGVGQEIPFQQNSQHLTTLATSHHPSPSHPQ